MGVAMRATAFTAESRPITAPRLLGGTHCISRMGIAGVNSGIPVTYSVAANSVSPAVGAAPIAPRPTATSASPSAVVDVSPSFLFTLAKPAAEMEKDTAANAVSVAPICVGPIPHRCAQNTGKNESNVLCPALYRKEVTQMVATAAYSLRPKGHAGADSASVRACSLAACRAALLAEVYPSISASSPDSSSLTSLGRGVVTRASLDENPALVPISLTATATMNAAPTLAQPVTAMHAPRSLFALNINPPNVGPTMNASVHAASRHAMNDGSCSGVAASARYALTTGDAPAKAPDATLRPRNVANDHPFVTHAACATNPTPTPRRDVTSIGLRPTASLSRGHAKSAKNMPSGYALVRYPTCAGCRPKCATRDGVMGPVTVNPRRWRNTASMTHATLTYCAVVPGANPSSSSRRRDLGSRSGSGLGARPSRDEADDAATERRRGRAGITSARDLDADAGRDTTRSHRPPRAGRRIVKPRDACRGTGPPTGCGADLARRWPIWQRGGARAGAATPTPTPRMTPAATRLSTPRALSSSIHPRDRSRAIVRGTRRALWGHAFKPWC